MREYLSKMEKELEELPISEEVAEKFRKRLEVILKNGPEGLDKLQKRPKIK